ncbi:MAG TPA: metallophosphoesterase [Opitutales bacterium]|nr:metallophosphoesterase [Opitutales bacterium]
MKTTVSKLTRRQFLGFSAGAAALLTGDAVLIEPSSIKTRFVKLADGDSTHRIVHFSDVHHKGDRAYLAEAVAQINQLSPDLVCFTGDLVEEARHLPEALEELKKIKAPLFGVPGNHDYTSGADFRVINDAFVTTGGRWLLNENVALDGGQINLIGAVCDQPKFVQPLPGAKNVVLMHYPVFVSNLDGRTFDLMLAGHSHGGQVRLPLYGAIILPEGVGKYDLGLFQTDSGPLYVNPGLGWLHLDVRFNCRPELTVFEV